MEKLPFKKVLVANRGEIAVRILRACKELGLQTVAVYSSVDNDSAHVALADESIFLGEPAPSASYLNQEKILTAAKKLGADAIHPGFGFFSENAEFARACAEAKICFIGPNPKTIDLMGDKLRARKCMEEAGVPTVPGSNGGVNSIYEAKEWANKIGFPVLFKAAAGGGGKGMRVVRNAEEIAAAFDNTRREALNYFGNPEIFIEKYMDNPHHIEVQILGDKHGNLVHLFERECSIQRRHQKVIEEAPAPFLVGFDNIREKLFTVAIAGAKNVAYDSAGTMEFIMDGNRNFYFLEMNTRIQVEHPVTEMVTGIDIVKEQIRIAGGRELSFNQNDLALTGAAIECRLYAEHPVTFMPTPGPVFDSWFPGGPFVRIDTAIMNGQRIPLDYDPMIAKISVWGRNRKETIQRMQSSLREVMIAGCVTNITFLRLVLDHKKFHSGIYTTKFIDEEKSKLVQQPTEDELEKFLAMVSTMDQCADALEIGRRAQWTTNGGGKA